MTPHNPNPGRNPNWNQYPSPTPTPLPHPGNPNDARWLPPHDQDVVNTATLRRADGEIVVYEPTGTGWIQTPDWIPLTHCE